MKTGIAFTESITLVTEECITCGVMFALPDTLREKLKNTPERSFYCPNGHSMVFRHSKIQLALDEANRKLREAENALVNISTQKMQLQSQLDKSDKQLKRLTNGVCPCCNRSFRNLQQHMTKKHPEVVSKKR